MSIDIPLMKFLSTRENFDRYRKYLKSNALLSEAETIINDMGEWFRCYPSADAVEWESFALWFRVVRHPMYARDKHEMYDAIFRRVQATAPTTDASIINKFVELDYAGQVMSVLDKLSRGEVASIEDITGIIERYRMEVGGVSRGDEDSFVAPDLAGIVEDMYRSGGVNWRLEDLNISVGPLRGGDMVIVGARPETGKTSFICSEMTYMAQQLPDDKDIIIFNNEEDGRKIFARLVQCALGKTMGEIALDDKASMDAYEKLLKRINRIKVVHKEGTLSVHDIDRITKAGNYGMVCINVLDKVVTSNRDQAEVERVRGLAQWARNLGIRTGATVFAVMQADGSAEGQAWLNQGQLYGSKTGVQGEADVIIMIGHSGEFDTRYISVCKNKLPGSPKTDPTQKHGKFDVKFDALTGLYTSKRY